MVISNIYINNINVTIIETVGIIIITRVKTKIDKLKIIQKCNAHLQYLVKQLLNHWVSQCRSRLSTYHQDLQTTKTPRKFNTLMLYAFKKILRTFFYPKMYSEDTQKAGLVPKLINSKRTMSNVAVIWEIMTLCSSNLLKGGCVTHKW